MEFSNQILHGDCIEVLRSVPAESVGLVVTDPPYGVHYRDRTGRTVANDDCLDRVLGAFSQVYRIMRPDTVCISFYGWNKVDAFFTAWRRAGFYPVGHVVLVKGYASNRRFLEARHEQAYVLAKGRPSMPSRPIADVRKWQYSGNRAHPTEKAVGILKPLVECFSRPGDLILDPFCGSGSTCVAAAVVGRRYLGVDLVSEHCETARRRLTAVRQNRTDDARFADALSEFRQWLHQQSCSLTALSSAPSGEHAFDSPRRTSVLQ
jgi:site-specific DNA-methyltransferase (adenine-specific)